MDKSTKLIAAVTALLVAAGGLFASVGGLFGGDSGPTGITVILDSREAFEAFISNHPSKG